ncbi:MAG: hypothetical protein KAU83_04720 [Bacteroidales bacterium]|nr:hypothetical protein [Bacteroidales bacterium]
MDRRNFIKTTGAGTVILTSPMFSSHINNLLAQETSDIDLYDIPRPIDVKLKVKPVYGQRIPNEVHEGPCRASSPVGWNRNEEILQAGNNFNKWVESVKKNLCDKAVMLQPTYIQYAGDHRINTQYWTKVEKDLKDTDLFLVHYRVPGIEKFNNSCASLDVTAQLRNKGLESYGLYDFEKLNELVALLQVRKALQQTKMLIVTDGPWETEYNTVHSNIADLKELNQRLGIDCQFVSFKEFFNEMDLVIKNKNVQKFANKITDKLINNAQNVHMKKDDILSSVNYYLSVKKLMKKYNCNSFSATCQELCVAGYAAKYKITPCLTHTLLKDQGYPSSCEADTNVLVSMMLQMYLTNKSTFMGNTLIHDRNNNLLYMHHDVPGIKMKGLDQPDLPYEIRNFTEKGWGATVRYDFSLDKGEKVTFCRLNPAATKLLIVAGEIEGCYGFNKFGCSLGVTIKVKDVMEYFHEAINFGHHFSMVYGDHLAEMQKLAEILNIETVAIA